MAGRTHKTYGVPPLDRRFDEIDVAARDAESLMTQSRIWAQRSRAIAAIGTANGRTSSVTRAHVRFFVKAYAHAYLLSNNVYEYLKRESPTAVECRRRLYVIACWFAEQLRARFIALSKDSAERLFLMSMLAHYHTVVSLPNNKSSSRLLYNNEEIRTMVLPQNTVLSDEMLMRYIHLPTARPGDVNDVAFERMNERDIHLCQDWVMRLLPNDSAPNEKIYFHNLGTSASQLQQSEFYVPLILITRNVAERFERQLLPNLDPRLLGQELINSLSEQDVAYLDKNVRPAHFTVDQTITAILRDHYNSTVVAARMNLVREATREFSKVFEYPDANPTSPETDANVSNEPHNEPGNELPASPMSEVAAPHFDADDLDTAILYEELDGDDFVIGLGDGRPTSASLLVTRPELSEAAWSVATAGLNPLLHHIMQQMIVQAAATKTPLFSLVSNEVVYDVGELLNLALQISVADVTRPDYELGQLDAVIVNRIALELTDYASRLLSQHLLSKSLRFANSQDFNPVIAARGMALTDTSAEGYEAETSPFSPTKSLWYSLTVPQAEAPFVRTVRVASTKRPDLFHSPDGLQLLLELQSWFSDLSRRVETALNSIPDNDDVEVSKTIGQRTRSVFFDTHLLNLGETSYDKASKPTVRAQLLHQISLITRQNLMSFQNVRLALYHSLCLAMDGLCTLGIDYKDLRESKTFERDFEFTMHKCYTLYAQMRERYQLSPPGVIAGLRPMYNGTPALQIGDHVMVMLDKISPFYASMRPEFYTEELVSPFKSASVAQSEVDQTQSTPLQSRNRGRR